MLPGLIIIGAGKSGTTALFWYLGQHPGLAPSALKEVDFFTNHYRKGQAWYRSNFPTRQGLAGRIAFEASPSYLQAWQEVPDRIRRLIPDVRLVAVLRNPADRAISHYFHRVRHGVEDRPVERALAVESAADGPYLPTGHYAAALTCYLSVFPREQLLVLQSEPMLQDPQPRLWKVFEFVGVDPDFRVPHTSPIHVGDNRVPVDEAIRQRLVDYFRPHNEDLYRLLGTRFDWDTEPEQPARAAAPDPAPDPLDR